MENGDADRGVPVFFRISESGFMGPRSPVFARGLADKRAGEK